MKTVIRDQFVREICHWRTWKGFPEKYIVHELASLFKLLKLFKIIKFKMLFKYGSFGNKFIM